MKTTLRMFKEILWDERNTFGKVLFSFVWIIIPIVLLVDLLELIWNLTEKK